MHENYGDAVVCVDRLQRVLLHQHKIGDFSRLDGSDLRIWQPAAKGKANFVPEDSVRALNDQDLQAALI